MLLQLVPVAAFAALLTGSGPMVQRRAELSMVASAPPLLNDLMVRAARGEEVERVPIWLFRQAGRHLPEYTAYKEKTGKNFIELLQDPVDVAECTLQPIRRYDLDAAILFSDILVIAQALGLKVEMPGGKGIVVPAPLTSPADFERITLPTDAASAKTTVESELGHVLRSVELIVEQLEGKVPLIGFSAAPWTLFYYMVGGSSKKNLGEGERWLSEHAESSRELLDALCTIVIEYMSLQVEKGAVMLQLFEAMAMEDKISRDSFQTWAIPYMRRICSELKARHPDVPLMVFPRGAAYSLPALREAGFDVLTLDASLERGSVRELLPDVCLQGDFDPALLVTGDEAAVRKEAAEMLDALGGKRLIANLCEGLGGKEKPELVSVLIDAVHSHKI